MSEMKKAKKEAKSLADYWLKKTGNLPTKSIEEKSEIDSIAMRLVSLGVLITAFNYSLENREKFAIEYQKAKMLYAGTHHFLRDWELENCKEKNFADFPSEILRKKVQHAVGLKFKNGFEDIDTYFENINIFLLVLQKDYRPKKYEKKSQKPRESSWYD